MLPKQIFCLEEIYFCYFTAELLETGTGPNALHIAAKKNLLEAAKWLINDGTDLEAKTSDGMTPLHTAVTYNSVPVARELIRRGANLDATDNSGRRPIDLAKSSEIKALLGRRKFNLKASTLHDGRHVLTDTFRKISNFLAKIC